MSAQKKRREREKDRNRKRVLAEAKKDSTIDNNPPNHTGATPANQESNPVQIQCQLNAALPVLSTSSGYKTDFSRRKATWRIKRLMPKSPQKYDTIAAGLVVSASPRKKLLHDMMLGGKDKYVDSVLGYVKQTCKQMSTANRIMCNANLAAILGSASKQVRDASSRKLGISQKIIRKYDRLRKAGHNEKKTL